MLIEDKKTIFYYSFTIILVQKNTTNFLDVVKLTFELMYISDAFIK